MYIVDDDFVIFLNTDIMHVASLPHRGKVIVEHERNERDFDIGTSENPLINH